MTLLRNDNIGADLSFVMMGVYNGEEDGEYETARQFTRTFTPVRREHARTAVAQAIGGDLENESAVYHVVALSDLVFYF
ncbi:hypothetical protein J25TS5_17180 [Paenibacillus faecis]|uniref:hypothetical protein n=1 Tax=Paenibacillus faecis TaxID=862114 RepID=UPI001B11EA3F|nr:hypothetical protein [Paenibacillus faecis]GIO84786.1 hypothetical protein J25TS5_17180 [Paenibacillus faecis]